MAYLQYMLLLYKTFCGKMYLALSSAPRPFSCAIGQHSFMVLSVGHLHSFKYLVLKKNKADL